MRLIWRRLSASAAQEEQVRKWASKLAESSGEQAPSTYASSLPRHRSHVIAKPPVIWPPVIRAWLFARAKDATSPSPSECLESRRFPGSLVPPDRKAG